MKPPHGNRPGGPPRPPSDRGPHRGPGGPTSRPSGGGQEPRGRDQNARPQGGGPGGGGFQSRPNRDGAAREGFKPGQGSRDGYKGASGDPRDGNRPAPSGPREVFKSAPGGPREGFKPGPGGPREGFKPRHGGQPQRGQDAGTQRHGHQPRHGQEPRGTPDAPRGTVWLYGIHAVAAALTNPARRLRRLMLTEEAEAALSGRISPPWALAVERAERGRLDHLLGRDVVHQGAALLADPLTPPSLQSVLEKPGVIVVLDQVTDPRNVGAILRSAAAFGAAAVITQDRNAPEETGGLAKAASGALETLPLLRAVNIARTLIALKAANVWCVGLDAAGPPLSGPAYAGRRVALVLGAEGEGMRRLTRETCDEVAGLAIKGAVESLNVSAAASVALYELTRTA